MTKIAVFTSSRADYGLLSKLIDKLNNEIGIDVHFIVTGTHLSQKHGMTVQEIIEDGFQIYARIEVTMEEDDPVDLTNAVADLQRQIAIELKALSPDAMIILGDRFEALPAAYAAALQRIKIVHLHGGEITLGAIDNKIRFAISHLADFHLTATERSKQRLISGGIDEKYVVNTGAIGVENAMKVVKYSRAEIESKTGFRFRKNNILFTFHPETISKLSARQQINTVLDGLAYFQEAAKFISLPNADPGNQIISQCLENFSNSCSNIYFAKNFGHRLYLSLMGEVDVVVGNSSSGIIEAPALGVATVDIGDRQKGREKASSVVECGYDQMNIKRAIQKAISSKKSPPLTKHPYYQDDTCNLMVSSIKEFLSH